MAVEPTEEGRTDASQALAEAAARIDRGMELVRQLAATLGPAMESLAKASVELGDCESARRLFDHAATLATASGHRRQAAAAVAAREQLGPGAHDEPRAAAVRELALERQVLQALPGWTALSNAEQHVAVMAASGRTNAEISQALYVSVNTVKTHVARVFAKLGQSRRELTRLVAQPPR